MTDVHANAKRSIKLLMGRQVLLQILTFGGGVVLARVLGPAQFGLYSIAVFLVAVFALFGDFGLAPSLIQRKEDLTELDLRVAFTVQQIVTTIIVLLLMVLAPWLAHFYPKAPPATVWLVRALAVNLYLSSWRTMSALQLERHLKYDKLAKIEVVEALTYQGIAVCLAVTGHGVWSYVLAVLASGILGNLLVFGASPWRVRFAYDKAIARDILRFGIPFQIQLIVNQLGHCVTPVMVGSLIGPQAVGYIGWAASNGKKPLMLVDNVMRVSFPHFSRIQDDRVEVERLLVKYLNWLMLPAGLWFAVLLIAGPPLVYGIYTPKWMPAVPCLILYSLALWFEVISYISAVTLNSLGQVKFTLRVYAGRTILNIVAGIIFVLLFGFNGIPLGYVVSFAVTIPWLLSGFGQGAFRRLLRPISWILVPVAVSIFIGWLALQIPASLLKVHACLALIAVVSSYAASVWIIGPGWIKAEVIAKIPQKFTPNANAFAIASSKPNS